MFNQNSECLWFLILILILFCCGGCGCSNNDNYMPKPPCCND